MTPTPLRPVGFIGLGDQGLPMAVAIADAGYTLHAWTRRPRSLDGLNGVPHIRHETLADLAGASTVVCLCVSTDHDVMDLLTGGLSANLRPGTIVVNHGTGTPAQALQHAAACAAAAVEFLDAPVSGAHAGAVARTLTTMVGGPEAAAEICAPIFETFSSHVVRLGGHGVGQLAKLLNNALMMMNHASVADILELATRLSIDPIGLAEVLKTSSGSSVALEILPTGTAGLPAEMAEHGRDVLLLDMKLFDTAMSENGADVHHISERAVSGATRVLNTIRILNP
jgi:3-hydroxyisobutyrate dehydrogenase-like beta-hydroxyacid dehydrogenase